MPDDSRHQRVVLETARHRIVGEVTLPAEGVRSRLSDLLNREGLTFVALIDAEITQHSGGPAFRLPFVAVAREAIQIAYEDKPSG
jgi:hypothetical protein